jgi:hypothetical protein
MLNHYKEKVELKESTRSKSVYACFKKAIDMIKIKGAIVMK